MLCGDRMASEGPVNGGSRHGEQLGQVTDGNKCRRHAFVLILAAACSRVLVASRAVFPWPWQGIGPSVGAAPKSSKVIQRWVGCRFYMTVGTLGTELSTGFGDNSCRRHPDPARAVARRARDPLAADDLRSAAKIITISAVLASRAALVVAGPWQRGLIMHVGILPCDSRSEHRQTFIPVERLSLSLNRLSGDAGATIPLSPDRERF
jgi:hypothetical protein